MKIGKTTDAHDLDTIDPNRRIVSPMDSFGHQFFASLRCQFKGKIMISMDKYLVWYGKPCIPHKEIR